MYREEAREGAGVTDIVLGFMLEVTPTRGRAGSTLRTAIGYFTTNAVSIIQNDLYGPPLDNIFMLAQQTGINRAQMKQVRFVAAGLDPWSLGGTIVKNTLINFALASETRLLADMIFRSRSDVERIKKEMNDGFNAMEEIAADDMDQITYQTLVSLHAAVSFFLTEVARPLPRMLQYRFNQVFPSLIVAYKLYADAARADELRMENKIIHPAFMPLIGLALSK